MSKISGFNELFEFLVFIKDKLFPIDGSKVDIELFLLIFLNLAASSLKIFKIITFTTVKIKLSSYSASQ
jgi:hypothetical protein